MLQLNVTQRLANFDLAISINLPINKITAIYGPSGAGKSSLLRIIAGLEHSNVNEIIWQQQIWQDKQTFIPPEKRRIGLLFQDAYLFPHLNIKDNLLFVVKQPNHELFAQLVNDLGLQHLLSRMPHKLSGGEKQKITLARALLHSPQLLVLDEAFSAIDKATSLLLLEYLKNYQLPIIMVSHNSNEIIHSADYVVKMATGKILQHGDIYTMLEYFEEYNQYDLLLDVTESNNNNVLVPQLGLINLPSWQKVQQTSRILINANNISIQPNRQTPFDLGAQIIQIHSYPNYTEIVCQFTNQRQITLPLNLTSVELHEYAIGQHIFLSINSFRFI